MLPTIRRFLLVLLVLALALATGRPALAESAFADVPTSSFCVTSGKVDSAQNGALHVNVGVMRGVVAKGQGDAAELVFTYRGPSETERPLTSGELRRQIGLKLRAQDTCNVVYVMWHLEPSQGIFVSLKNNPGESLHKQCGVRGYTNLTKRGGVPVPHVTPGAWHTLRAEIHGEDLNVFADGVPVWKGALPSAALDLEGPAGVRSDNGNFDFMLRVPGGSHGAICPERMPGGTH